MSSDGSRCHDRAYRLIVSPNCVKGRSDISRRMSAVFTSMIGEPVPVSADLLVPASFRVNKHSLLARRCDSTPQSYTTSRNAREIQLHIIGAGSKQIMPSTLASHCGVNAVRCFLDDMELSAAYGMLLQRQHRHSQLEHVTVSSRPWPT